MASIIPIDLNSNYYRICEECQKEYKTMCGYYHHYFKYHNKHASSTCPSCGMNVLGERCTQPRSKRNFTCDICKETFLTKIEIANHHKLCRYWCNMCNYTCVTKQTLEKHNDNCHSAKICQICKKLFLSSRSLHYHKKNHKCNFKPYISSNNTVSDKPNSDDLNLSQSDVEVSETGNDDIDVVQNNDFQDINIVESKSDDLNLSLSDVEVFETANNEIDVVQNIEYVNNQSLEEEANDEQKRLNNEIVDYIEDRSKLTSADSDPYLSTNFGQEIIGSELKNSDQSTVTSLITEDHLLNDGPEIFPECNLISQSVQGNDEALSEPSILQNFKNNKQDVSLKCLLNFDSNKDTKKYRCRKCRNILSLFDTREELYIHHMSVHNQLGAGENLQPLPWIEGQEPWTLNDDSELKKIYMLNSPLILQPHHYDSK